MASITDGRGRRTAWPLALVFAGAVAVGLASYRYLLPGAPGGAPPILANSFARYGFLTVHAGFACIVAGALGNALDRATRGHVVDFIHVHFWPVFNVADILVVAGIAILALWRVAAPGDLRSAP